MVTAFRDTFLSVKLGEERTESESEKCRSIHVSQQISRNSFGNEFYLFGIAHLSLYHWGGCHRYHFCRDKHLATKVCLSRQNFCCNKNMFVATKYFCILSRQNFCYDKYFSRQNYVCRDKCLSSFCRGRSMLVATKLLSRQT